MIASSARVLEQSAPVRAYVRRAWRALVLRRATEAVAVAVAAALACMAASVVSGADWRLAGAWFVACAVGWLAASSWWLEHPPTEGRVARTLDRDGALVTAYECELQGDRTQLQSLLSIRVAGALAATGRPRVARTPAVSIWGAPLAAGALLALALESGPSHTARAVDVRRAALAESARTLGAAVDHETGLPPSVEKEVRALARTAEILAATRSRAPRLADFADRARQTAVTRVEHAGVRDALMDSASAAEELSRALGEDSARALRHSASGQTAPADGRPGVGLGSATGRPLEPRGGETSAAGGGESGTDMPDGPPDVTMLRHDPDQARPPAAQTAVEHGLPAVRWWPRRFDAIVERWVENQRAPADR